MLGLGEHVQSRQIHRVGPVAGVELCLELPAEHDQQVAGTGEAVDAHARGELVLGLLYVEVARTDDHIDGGDGVGAVCERRDRLCAAHPVDALNPAQPAGAEDHRVDLPAGAGRRAHGDLDHARRARGDDAHHHGAGVGGAATRHVHGGRADWDLAQHDALALWKIDGGVAVHAGVGDQRDVGDRHLETCDQLERQALDRLVELLRVDEQRPRLRAGGVELARVIEHGAVALAPDALEDRAHLL